MGLRKKAGEKGFQNSLTAVKTLVVKLLVLVILFFSFQKPTEYQNVYS